MPTFESVIGAEQTAFTLDGSNSIDIFPIFTFDPQGASSPDYGTITIQGVTIPTELWAVNEYKTAKFEITHAYLDGGYVDNHCRIFPIDDNAGTVNFKFDYFILHIDGTTTTGETLTLSGTVIAGSKTANTGYYIEAYLTSDDLVGGDQIIGTFKRIAGTYASDVALMEIGLHTAIGRTGKNFG